MELETKLTVKDMYRFNLYHTYTSFQGIFTIIIGLGVIALALYAKETVSISYMVIYLVLGIIFLVYTPINLYLSSKHVIHKSDAFRHPMQYSFDDEGTVIRIVGVNKEEILHEEEREFALKQKDNDEDKAMNNKIGNPIENKREQHQEEASVKVPWKLVYKIIQTKHNVLIYTSRRNAYIIPMRDMKPKLGEFQTLVARNLKKYQWKLKGE